MVVFIKRNQITVVSVHFYKQFIVYPSKCYYASIWVLSAKNTCSFIKGFYFHWSDNMSTVTSHYSQACKRIPFVCFKITAFLSKVSMCHSAFLRDNKITKYSNLPISKVHPMKEGSYSYPLWFFLRYLSIIAFFFCLTTKWNFICCKLGNQDVFGFRSKVRYLNPFKLWGKVLVYIIF